MLSIEVEGAVVVRQGLENLGAAIPEIGRLRIYRAMQAVVRTVKKYPAAVPGSSYARTYRLQKSWNLVRQSNGYTLSSQATSPYGVVYTPFVVGDAYGSGQATVHRRWPLVRKVVDDELSKLPKQIEGDIIVKARQLGF